jgi:AGZA family xanthine/uracil permease-like MFS transporter
MFSGLVLAALGVWLIERRFLRASAWAAVGAGLSAGGLMHSYSLTDTALREEIRPGWAWEMTLAYLALALLFALAALVPRLSRDGRAPPGARGNAPSSASSR